MYIIAGSTICGVCLISMLLVWLINTTFLVLQSQEGQLVLFSCGNSYSLESANQLAMLVANGNKL